MTGRLRITLCLLLFSFGIIIVRLFYWQVVKADELALLGKSQYGSLITTAPRRGDIKTSDGYPIATNTVSYLVFANPKEVKDKKKTAEELAAILDVGTASISASLAFDRLWVPIKSGVDTKIKETIEKLNLDGIGFKQQSSRFYPEASLAAHLVGFVGKDDNGENKGYFGLEGYYDRQLRGKPGLAIVIHDAFGRPILSHATDTSGSIDGRTLVLHIDRSIQFFAETRLKEGIEKYQASGGVVGIIEPHSGSVLAMASFPNFDPSLYQDYSDALYKNPFITNTYEPGSTFKTITMSAGLDANTVTPETKCTICSGPVEIGEYEIRTWDNKYYKDTTMIDVIRHSDNTGMVYVSQTLGLDRMLSYFQKFGIGDMTGIDLQGEVEPTLREKNYWHTIDVATAAFGQGVSVTPIELLTAFASLANEGIRMEPHVVAKIKTPGGETFTIPPKALGAAISTKTAKVMTEILVNAVDNGEAKWAKPKGFRIAGKTGTSQIPIAGHYDPNKTIASFIGFAPADNPKFAMLVIVDRPTTSIYGSETAAPIFFTIAKDIFAYYDIPPSE